MLDTDASEEAIGAELSQVQEGQERPMVHSLRLSLEVLRDPEGTPCSDQIYMHVSPLLAR